MSSEILQTIPIECLAAATKDAPSQKVIRLLPDYNIKTLFDLSQVSYEQLIITPGLGKTKIETILQLAELIKDKQIVKIVEDYYERYMKVHLLPSRGNDDELPGAAIKRFLKEYVSLFRDLQEQKLVRRTFMTHDLVELAYLYNFTNEMIAINKHLKKSERVRQILTSSSEEHKSFMWQLRRMVNDGCSDSDAGMVQLSEEFKKQLKEIEVLCNRCPLLKDFKEQIGLGNSVEDSAIVRFILNYTGTKLFGGDIGTETRIKEQFIVNVDIKDLKTEWGRIVLLLDDKVVPYAKEAMLVDIQKRGNRLSPEVQGAIINIIENSNQFERVDDGIVVKYQLHWKDLCSAQSRLERIIYEAGEPCSKQYIFNEYNRRAMQFGIEPIDDNRSINSQRDSGINRHKKIQNIVEYNAGGVWAWKDSLESTQTFTITDVINQYLINKNEEFSFDEIYEYVCQYIQHANIRSIRTTLNKLCYSTRRGYYLRKDINADELDDGVRITTREDITSDIVNVMKRDRAYTYCELESLLSKKSVRISKIRRCCENHPEIFLIDRGDNRRVGNLISINPDWDDVYEPKANTRQRKVYKDDMRRQAIHLLRVKDGYRMPKLDLIKQIKVYLPDNIKPNNVYKIINDDPIFITSGKGRGQYVTLNRELWADEYQQAVDNNSMQSIEQIEGTPQSSIVDKKRSGTENIGAFYDININFEADMDKLRNGVYNFVQYELQQIAKDNNIIDFETAWEKLVASMNIRSDKYDSDYERIFVMMYRYLFGKTDIYDRYYLYCDLLLSLEAYMTKLIGQSFNGLVAAVEAYQAKGILPARYADNILNKYVGEIISSRNKRAHNEVYTLTDTLVLSKTKKLLVLYLYIAYKKV